jgi:hypothetical protein
MWHSDNKVNILPHPIKSLHNADPASLSIWRGVRRFQLFGEMVGEALSLYSLKAIDRKIKQQ